MLADGSSSLSVSETNNVTSDLHGLFDALMLPVKSQEDLVRRRKIMRTNIFKSRYVIYIYTNNIHNNIIQYHNQTTSRSTATKRAHIFTSKSISYEHNLIKT
jgi:hypothetical protein